MPHLSAPSLHVHESFLEGMDGFIAEGRGEPGDDSALARDIEEFSSVWRSRDGFARFIASLHEQGDTGVPPPKNWVHSSTCWWVDGSTYLGSIRIRHTLTPYLFEVGGHIGYDIAPAHRMKGHGTAMLRAALPIAARLGVDKALVTCDTDNVGSRRIIESCGGVFEDERHGKLRYWVATS
jgi:predicted acetyltransferase